MQPERLRLLDLDQAPALLPKPSAGAALHLKETDE